MTEEQTFSPEQCAEVLENARQIFVAFGKQLEGFIGTLELNADKYNAAQMALGDVAREILKPTPSKEQTSKKTK